LDPAAMKRISLFILILLILAPPAISQVPDDLLIVPGQRIGRVKLDSSIDEVIQLYGNPSSTYETSAGLLLQGNDALLVTLYYWNSVALKVATRDRVKIEYIFLDVTVPLMRGYKTEQGIARGVPRQVVERVYGQPTARTVTLVLQGTPLQERWIYDRIGLWLSILVGDVYTLGVFRPGEAKNNWKF